MRRQTRRQFLKAGKVAGLALLVSEALLELGGIGPVICLTRSPAHYQQTQSSPTASQKYKPVVIFTWHEDANDAQRVGAEIGKLEEQCKRYSVINFEGVTTPLMKDRLEAFFKNANDEYKQQSSAGKVNESDLRRKITERLKSIVGGNLPFLSEMAIICFKYGLDMRFFEVYQDYEITINFQDFNNRRYEIKNKLLDLSKDLSQYRQPIEKLLEENIDVIAEETLFRNPRLLYAISDSIGKDNQNRIYVVGLGHKGIAEGLKDNEFDKILLEITVPPSGATFLYRRIQDPSAQMTPEEKEFDYNHYLEIFKRVRPERLQQPQKN